MLSAEKQKKTPQEKLAEPELPAKVAKAIKEKLEAFVDGNEDFMTGDKFEELLSDACGILREKVGLPEITDKVEDIGTGVREKYSGDVVNGTVSFMGEQILTYASSMDNENMSIKSWDEEALNSAVRRYIDKLKAEAV
ncbi:MAG: hypothetical protein WC551_04390 [Patescibacteria group bacterium]